MTFADALQIVFVSVCTGFGLEIAKELVHAVTEKVKALRKR